MKTKLASAFAWMAPCVLFLFRDEILSLLALLALSLMALAGIIMAREAM